MAFSDLVNEKTFIRYSRTSFKRAPAAYRDAREIIYLINRLVTRAGMEECKIDFGKLCASIGEWEPRDVSNFAIWLNEQYKPLVFAPNKRVAEFVEKNFIFK